HGGAQPDGGEAFALLLDPLAALAAYGCRHPGSHEQIRIGGVDDCLHRHVRDVAFRDVDFRWHFEPFQQPQTWQSRSALPDVLSVARPARGTWPRSSQIAYAAGAGQPSLPDATERPPGTDRHRRIPPPPPVHPRNEQSL